METTAISQATSTINSGIGTLASSYETFLTLLTAQLKNQDPLSPLDNNQFTQQLAQMTGVQQQLLTNQLLTQLLDQDQASLGASAVNMIGKTVTIESRQAHLTEDGASWTYELAGTPASTKLEVVAPDGRVVWTGQVDADKGMNTFDWDGRTLAGAAQPTNQNYTLRVTALDTSGEKVASTGLVTGIATRLESAGNQTLLTVRGVQAPLTSVTSIEYAPDAA